MPVPINLLTPFSPYLFKRLPKLEGAQQIQRAVCWHVFQVDLPAHSSCMQPLGDTVVCGVLKCDSALHWCSLLRFRTRRRAVPG